jgi:diguanylate cyclase (GGDEF)-like protein
MSAWRLPLAGALTMLIIGIAALHAGDKLRSANLNKEAQSDALAIAASIQSQLLAIAGDAAALQWPVTLSEESPANERVYWHFDGRQLRATPDRLLADPAIRQQLTSVPVPGLSAPLTTATGRDLVLVTARNGNGWTGISIPVDRLIGKLPESRVEPASVALDWADTEHLVSNIFRADMDNSPRQESLTFPVPGGRWQLHYNSTVAAELGELRWALYLIVVVLSYLLGLVLYRQSIKPLGLQADLDSLSNRFNNLNDEFAALLATREQIQDQVQRLSVSDMATGLPNRQAFIERLDAALTGLRGATEASSLSIVVVGLKDVEKAERTLGHSVISGIFPQVAERLRAVLDEENFIARVNDYQLAVLLPGLDATEAVRLAAELTSDKISGVYKHERGNINVAPRLGIATADNGFVYAENLMDDAISALSDAEVGSIRWSSFASDSRDNRVTQIQLESDFKSALENNEFRLFYQPIVHTHSGKPKGFECLVRWQHPIEGMLPPSHFIALSESTGLVTELTQWVLREAIRQAKAWENLQNLDCYLSINLSTLDLLYAPLARELTAMVRDAGLSPAMFRLEITESMLIDNLAQARDMLIQLRDAGFGIMMDDFGTGFSSLSYLRQLPFSAVKIDRSFTQAITWDSKDYGMVRNILSLIHFLEMESIIEGVENDEQHELLMPLDPVYCQGYLFAKPMPAIDAEEYLAAACLAPAVSATGT